MGWLANCVVVRFSSDNCLISSLFVFGFLPKFFSLESLFNMTHSLGNLIPEWLMSGLASQLCGCPTSICDQTLARQRLFTLHRILNELKGGTIYGLLWTGKMQFTGHIARLEVLHSLYCGDNICVGV